MTSDNDPDLAEDQEFGEPIDQAEEDAVLTRLSNRNRKRILIPLAILILVVIALSFVKDPVKDQKPSKAAPTTTAP